jgi:hypothetical protein
METSCIVALVVSWTITFIMGASTFTIRRIQRRREPLIAYSMEENL